MTISPEAFVDIQRQETNELDSIIGLIKDRRYMEAMSRLKRLSDVKRFRTGELLTSIVE